MKELTPISHSLSNGKLFSKRRTIQNHTVKKDWADRNSPAPRTDPDTFTIELVNQNVYPPTTEVVATDVDSSKGSYTVKGKTFNGVDQG